MTTINDDTWRVGYPSEAPVTGRVTIVRSQADRARVLQGDILVAPRTDISYAAQMLAAAAVIAVEGGPYSHAASFAREHRIPCLFGASGVLDHLTDGDTITVDIQAKTITVGQKAS